MTMARGQAGYSLLELTVALAIMALVATVALPAAGAVLERMTLQGDARTLSLALRGLRERALDRQTDIAVTVSGRGGNVLDVSDGSAIILASGTVATVRPALVATWDGRITGAVVLSRGAARVQVRADRLTGRVSVGEAR
jgi:prepilin-type N-terminal cleavage/methylation domain-containing protein